MTLNEAGALTPKLLDLEYKAYEGSPGTIVGWEYKAITRTGIHVVVMKWSDEPGLYSLYTYGLHNSWDCDELWRELDPLSAQAILYHLFEGETDGTT